MTTTPRRRVIRATLLLISCAALGACSSSGDFVQPQTPRASVSEQIKTAEALAVRAQTAEREGRPDEALSLYQQAVRTYRDFPGVWYNMGLLLLEQGKLMEAREAFRTAGDLEPRDPRPPYAIGVIYEKQGWNQEAQRYYADALSRDANYQEALQRSVYLDMVQNTYTPITLERTRRALFAEQDPKWRDYFERTQLRLDALLNQATPESGAITMPETEQQPPQQP